MSNNPMQRIADLEAQNAALVAENTSLKTRSNGNGHMDADKLAEVVGLRVDRAGQLLREDFTGKLAGLISPYIDSTIRRCAEVELKQEDMEKKFETHRKAVASSAGELEATFVKLRKEAAKDWKAQRELIQQDLAHVDAFVKSFRAELQAKGSKLAEAVTSCNLAVRDCHEITAKMSVPVEQTIEHLNKIKSHGEEILNQAAQRLSNNYNNLRRPVLIRITALLFAAIMIQMVFGTFILWRNRTAINTNWHELTEHSEQQKQEMQELLNKAIEEAKQSQIDREAKVKMWDELIKGLPPQQRQDLISKLRLQFHKAEEKRLGDQMHSSYDQMNGTR